MQPEILFIDHRMIGVSKPAGMLSVPGIGPDKQDCLIARIREEYPEARIVHRLDRDTSGVMVLARDAETHRELSRQFHDREVVKRYIALVAGHIEEDEGEIDLPMRKDTGAANKPRQIIDHEHGRAALTRWRVLDRLMIDRVMRCKGEGVKAQDVHCETTITPSLPHPLTPSSNHLITRLELRPITGRSHQLRLHMKELGHPILGDDLYATPEVLALADRLMLHAEYLLVTDPWTAAPREFEAPAPF